MGSRRYRTSNGAVLDNVNLSGLDSYEREYSEITEINFSNGKVQFFYNTTLQNQYGPKLLSYIKVLNLAGQVVKTIRFDYIQQSVTGAGGVIETQNPCNFLSSILEEVNNNGTISSRVLYSFIYNNDNGFPKRFSFAQDKWGFYNGNNQNTSFIPIDELTTYGMPDAASVGANRSINTVHTKSGLLKEIIYPTKGKAIFEYEQIIVLEYLLAE